MLRLFLEGRELELTEDVKVAITKQFEELSNPTTIINDWSKTVSIPFTHKNDAIFGYFFRPDKLTTYMPSSNYLSTAPSSIKKWNGSTYVNDSLSSGNIVCDINAQYVQVGFQYQDWKYSSVKNFTCNNDWHSFEFNYIPEEDYRFEFSFRDMSSDAPNNEVYYVQWDLHDRNLTENETYVVSFKHKKSGNNYIIYDYSLSKKQSLTGINFDPLQKLDFRLEWNGATLMTGYAKLNEIKQKGGNGTYNITLFGQLGKIFQEMKKITFDGSTSDTQYLIHGEDYVEDYITKELVAASWNSDGQGDYTLQPVKINGQANPGYNTLNVIGFAPNNAISEGFDYKSYEYIDPNEANKHKTKTFEETIQDDDNTFVNRTGVEPGTVIPDGMLPREIGEYRSYLQLPYIYWNKLFHIFRVKAEKLTGYEFDLDTTWFNSTNPYWSNLVYMLKNFNIKNGDEKPNRYSVNETTSGQELCWSKNRGQIPYGTPQSLNMTISSVQENFPRLEDNHIKINTEDSIHLSDYSIDFYITGEMNHAHDILYTKNNMFLLYLNFLGESGKAWSKTVGVYRADTDNQSIIDAANTVSADEGSLVTISYDNRYGTSQSITSSSTYGWHIRVSGNSLLSLDKLTWGDYVSVSVSAKWLNNNTVFGAAAGSSTSELCWLSNVKVSLKAEVRQNVFRSNAYFTLNDLWDNSYNLFTEVINYCKMFRIGIECDNANKKIKFKPLSRYFSNYQVVDWTNIVDKTKDFTIKPVTYEKKYVLFNYKDSKVKLSEGYKEKFGVNYGEYRLSTDYNFNSDTEKLFDKITQSINNTDNVLSWNSICPASTAKIMYSFPSEIYVANKNKDKKQEDVFGAFFFHNGTTNFSTESGLNMRPVCVSDDTHLQSSTATYVYTQNSDSTISVKTYPLLTIVSGTDLCTFNKPSERYTYNDNYRDKNSIYNNIWSNYLNERYNRQNKLLTCYVRLKPTTYNQFSWNKFVKIDDQIYMVNKIYDYDVNSNNSTKVDLISINNIEGYTKDGFSETILRVNRDVTSMPTLDNYDGYYREIGLSANNLSYWKVGYYENGSMVYLDDGDGWVLPSSGTTGNYNLMFGNVFDEPNNITYYIDAFNSSNQLIYRRAITVYFNDTAGSIITDKPVARTTVTHSGSWTTETSDTMTITSLGTWQIIGSRVESGNPVVSISRTRGNPGSSYLEFTPSSTSGTGTMSYDLRDNTGLIMRVFCAVTVN